MRASKTLSPKTLKMPKQIYCPSKSHISNKKAMCGTSGLKTESKNEDSWNKVKDKLIADECNKRRQTNACTNCGEVGHTFYDCSNPKP